MHISIRAAHSKRAAESHRVNICTVISLRDRAMRMRGPPSVIDNTDASFPADAPAKTATSARCSSAARKDGLLGEEAEAQAGGAHEAAWVPQQAWAPETGWLAELEEASMHLTSRIASVSHTPVVLYRNQNPCAVVLHFIACATTREALIRQSCTGHKHAPPGPADSRGVRQHDGEERRDSNRGGKGGAARGPAHHMEGASTSHGSGESSRRQGWVQQGHMLEVQHNRRGEGPAGAGGMQGEGLQEGGRREGGRG